MHRAKLPPMLQPLYSAGKSCVARRAAQACTSVSRNLLGSLIVGTHPATLAAHTGTGMESLEWLWTSQVNISTPGLHTELPCTCGFLCDCWGAQVPCSSVPGVLGTPLQCPPELVCGQDSNQENGWITNIPWPSGCTATTRLIFQLDECNDFGNGCVCSKSLF